jgi:hypothetical protein
VAELLSFCVLPNRLSVVRLDPRSAPPAPPPKEVFWSLTLTAEELSVVCGEAMGERLCRTRARGAGSVRIERGFRALKVRGPLDFSLTGVLSRLLAPLAASEIPVFVVSTFDTDYLLVRDEHLQRAVEALEPVGRPCPEPPGDL